MNLRGVVRTGLALAAFGVVWGQEPADPPSRVARLNYVNGQVSFRPDAVEEWTAASLNYPLTTGDHLWSDQGGYAEMHIGSTAVRLSGQTSFAILNLDDRAAQLSVSQGALNVRLLRLDPEEAFEVDTPSGAVSLLRAGEYRIDVYPDQNSTAVLVRAGEAEVTAGGQAFPVHARQMGRFIGTDQISSEVFAAPAPDDWDRWCLGRDQREDRAMQASMQYVPREMIGAEDLAGYGVWRTDPRYGAVWMPTGMGAGWAPYRHGHWAYVRPWGWTWVDDAPWGFAPFHYGRWAYMGGGWGWVPGRLVARPVYAPALVAFVGGRGFSAAISVGGGGGMAAWIPLGPHEAYRPAYHVSDHYVRNVNVTHVTNVTNINNVTNVTYVNRTYVTAVPQHVFVGAGPVSHAVVQVPPTAVNHFEHVDIGTMRPDHAGMVGRSMQPGMHVVVPPTAAVNRPVFVKTTPPASSHVIVPVRGNGPVGTVTTPANTTRPGFNPAAATGTTTPSHVINDPGYGRGTINPGATNPSHAINDRPAHVVNDRPGLNTNPSGSTGTTTPSHVINDPGYGRGTINPGTVIPSHVINDRPIVNDHGPLTTNPGVNGSTTPSHVINDHPEFKRRDPVINPGSTNTIERPGRRNTSDLNDGSQSGNGRIRDNTIHPKIEKKDTGTKIQNNTPVDKHIDKTNEVKTLPKKRA